LETAILHFQTEEIEMLWERFTVPSPKAMAKKYGMAITVSPDDAMKRVSSVCAPLVSGHGKLTDPSRTPNGNELVDALNELIEVSKGMTPGDRKEVLKQLRVWQKTIREHAKRLYQASYSNRMRDASQKNALRKGAYEAQGVRDDVTNAIAIIVKYKGGGFMKKATKTTAALAKEKVEKEAEAERRAERSKMISQYKQVAKDMRDSIIRGTGREIPDKTVGTFVKILEGYLWKAMRDSKSSYTKVAKKDFWNELMTVKRGSKADWRSDDKRDLQDLLKHVEKVFELHDRFSVNKFKQGDLEDNLKAFVNILKNTIRTGKFPHVPNEIKVQLRKPDKRQMTMKFEALQRLRLALAG
jgi:hypothetical protein